MVVTEGRLEVGEGDPVVLLHGSLGSKTQWRPLLGRLAGRYRAIALDLQGYGDNPLPLWSGRHSFEREVTHVLRRLRQIAAADRPLRLVGHSFGAGVALAFARRHPRSVASLALYEPPCFPVLATCARADYLRACTVAAAVARSVVAGEYRRALGAFADFWNAHGLVDRAPEESQAAVARRARRVAMDFEAILSAPGVLAAWERVTVPTLLLRGRRSPPEVSRAVEVLARWMPLATLETLEGDHFMPLRDPDPVNAAVERFLASPPGPECPRRAAAIRTVQRLGNGDSAILAAANEEDP